MEALERNRGRGDDLSPLTPNTELILGQIEEILVFNSRQTSPYTRRRAYSGSKPRCHGSSGSINRSRDSFQRIGSLKKLKEKPEPDTPSAASSSNNFVEVKRSKSNSASSSRLEMNDGAGIFLEEEVKLLEEMDRLKKARDYDTSSSDSEDMEMIEEAEVEAAASARNKAPVEVHHRRSSFNK